MYLVNVVMIDLLNYLCMYVNAKVHASHIRYQNLSILSTMKTKWTLSTQNECFAFYQIILTFARFTHFAHYHHHHIHDLAQLENHQHYYHYYVCYRCHDSIYQYVNNI